MAHDQYRVTDAAVVPWGHGPDSANQIANETKVSTQPLGKNRFQVVEPKANIANPATSS